MRTFAWFDPVEDHRALLRRDPAGEPLAQRDADALLDLLLDAAGGRRDQVLRRLVEQQHGRGVDAQQVAHPVEQLDQELLDAEVGECGVGDGLDAP